jgi:hypothetical protein
MYGKIRGLPHALHNSLGQTTAASSSVPFQKDMQGVSVCIRHECRCMRKCVREVCVCLFQISFCFFSFTKINT